jgi:DNA-binding GntR family transcriptional regulator
MRAVMISSAFDDLSSVMPERLAQALGREIIFAELAPGARIIEEDIARRYGVSRSPVRDALKRLEADGLVIRENHRGARVTPISRRDLDEVYLCRIELEGLAAEVAADHWTAPDDLDLRQKLEALRAAHGVGDIRSYFVANVGFTDAIHQASRNVTLQRLLKSVGKQALRYRFLAYQSVPGLMNTSVEGSQQIVDLILARDGAQARRITAKLIDSSWRSIRTAITYS